MDLDDICIPAKMDLAANKRDCETSVKQQTVVTKITGPEPGYIACSTFLNQSALTVLEESDKLCPYGVRTTGELLFKTTYLDRLKRHGIGLQTILSEV